MAIIQAQDMMVAVISGKKKEECKALNTVKKAGNVKIVVPIYTCPNMEDINEYMKDALNTMKECQKIVLQQIQEWQVPRHCPGYQFCFWNGSNHCQDF
jgi:uncharacterized protein YifN (PemK superfamily)